MTIRLRSRATHAGGDDVAHNALNCISVHSDSLSIRFQFAFPPGR
jgi:hypothetical protein